MIANEDKAWRGWQLDKQRIWERERDYLTKKKKAICKEKVYKHNKFDDKALRGWQLNKRERERERERAICKEKVYKHNKFDNYRYDRLLVVCEIVMLVVGLYENQYKLATLASVKNVINFLCVCALLISKWIWRSKDEILIFNDVGKFRPRLIELTNFKSKLLIRFIMNKTC